MREVDFAYKVGDVIANNSITNSGSLEVVGLRYTEDSQGSEITYRCWTRTEEVEYVILTEEQLDSLRKG
jgi:hypothetical protein